MAVSYAVCGACVLGDSHIQANTECQDAYKYKITSDGDWQAIVVCDGAGSSQRSAEASTFASDYFASSLISLSNKLNSRTIGAWVTDEIIKSILEIREQMRNRFKSENLDDFHTTLVALLLGPSVKLGGRSGIAVHVGDGAILGGNFTSSADGLLVDEQFSIISEPQNGEFANETYFITESQWIKRIRVTPVEKRNWYAVATDGGVAATFNSDLRPREDFPRIFEALRNKDAHDWQECVREHLSTKEVSFLTDDDKTLVLIFPKIIITDVPKNIPFLTSKQPAGNYAKADPELKIQTVQDQQFTPLLDGLSSGSDPYNPMTAVQFSITLFIGIALSFLMLFLVFMVAKPEACSILVGPSQICSTLGFRTPEANAGDHKVSGGTSENSVSTEEQNQNQPNAD